MAKARDAALPATLSSVSRARRPASERALVRAAQGGSSAAMEELFRRHWPRAHRAAWLVVHDAAAAEDVAQEAFLAAVRSLERFDRRRPVFETTGRLASPAWSPDGRRVLVRWVEADAWLLLPAAAAGPQAVAISPVAQRFGGVPVVRGWCCASG